MVYRQSLVGGRLLEGGKRSYLHDPLTYHKYIRLVSLFLSLFVVTSTMDVDSIPAPWPNREEDVNISSTFLSLLYILLTQYTKEYGGRGSEERGVTYLRLQRSIYIERNECGI
jgi:hypothetical protein